jgi:hypothetical protein
MRKSIHRRGHGLLDYAAMAALALAPRFLPPRARRAVLPALPWLLGAGRNRRARNLLLGLAAASLVVTVLTGRRDEDGEPDYAEGI